jgi:hypothetical protein
METPMPIAGFLEDLLEIEAQGSEALRREAKVDLLLLLAENLDLAHVAGAQELGARLLGEIPSLAHREPVIGHAIDDAENIPELVVVVGAEDFAREGLLDVVNLFPDLVPDPGNLGFFGGFTQVDVDRRDARLREALRVIEVGSLLELLLQPVRDLQHGVERGGARPLHLNDHRLHGKVGILLPAQPVVGIDARREHQEDQENDDDAVMNRPFGEVEPLHRFAASPGTTTFSPSARALTPAETTRSPSFTPLAMTTASSS